VGRGVVIGEGGAAAHPGRLSDRIDLDAVQPGQVDDQAAVADREPGRVVAARAHRHHGVVPPAEAHRAHDVVHVEAAGDEGRAPIDGGIPDAARRVVVGHALDEDVRIHPTQAER